MSFFKDIFGKAKDIIDNGKESVQKSLASEYTYTKPKEYKPEPFNVSQSFPQLNAVRNTPPKPTTQEIIERGKTQSISMPTRTPVLNKPFEQARKEGNALEWFTAQQQETTEKRRQALQEKLGTFAPWLVGTGIKEQPTQQKGVLGLLEGMGQTAREKGIPALMTESFNSKFYPSKEEASGKIMKYHDVLVSKGYDSDKAIELAVRNLADQTPNKSALSGLNIPGKDLPEDAKKALRFTNFTEDVFAMLDAPVFMGTTKPLKKGAELVLKGKGLKEAVQYQPLMREAVVNFSDVVNGVSKATKEEKVEIKAMAQSLADALVKNGKIELDVAVKTDKGLANMLVKHMEESDSVFNKLNSAEITPPKKVETPKPKPVSVSSDNLTTEAKTLTTLNPTGGVFVDYTPKTRATIPLGQNMTTLAKTANKSPDELVIIYRGAPKNQKGIVAGDFVTIDPVLAKTYGENVISKEVRYGDILDDIESPNLGEETLYRPNADKELLNTNYDFRKSDWYKNYSEYLVSNKDKFKTEESWLNAMKASGKTRAQLEDIWKQANQKGNLLEEAKKFKSVDEFVKAQGTPVYHGTNQDFNEFDISTIAGNEKRPEQLGIWFTDKPSTASEFGQNIKETYVSPDANLKEYTKDEWSVASSANSREGKYKRFREDLVKEGYDGVRIKPRQFELNGRQIKTDELIAVFNTEKIKTRTQLEDIWKQANPKKKSILQTFKDMTPAERQGGYAGNKPKEFPKKVMPIDRLIAENKVRVRMIDGADTYEVKKGGTWRKVRDEDSAVKQATPKPKVTQQLPDELENKLVAVDVAKEALASDPASQLGKYVSKKGEFKGRLSEQTKTKGGFGLDERAQELGFKSSEDARNAYDSYKTSKVEVEQQARAVRQEVRQYKQVARLKEKTVVPARAVDRVREIQKVAPAEVRSLEEVAQQIDELIDLPPRQKPASLEKIITQATPVDKKVNALDWIRTPDRVLNKIGFGKEAQLLRNQYEKYIIELPKNIDKVSEWVKRAPEKDSSERIFDFLDGKDIRLSASEQKVADEIREYLKEWADRLGLPEDKRVTNYITRLFDAELLAKEFDEDLAKIIADKVPGEVYNPFLQARLGAKGYKRDVWGALDAYTKRATRKVHIDPALEKIQLRTGSSLEYTNLEETQFKYIQKYIERVQMRPTEVDKAIDNGVKNLVGYRFGQRPVSYLSKLLRRMTYRGMLGANVGSAVRNLSQGINTYAVLGEKYTALGYAKLFDTHARKELADQGVLANDFIEDRILSSTKKTLQKADKALWFFFDQAEKINRGAAYFGAKAKALNNGATEEKAIEYAKSIVRKTQFAYDAVDAPVVLGSDIAKTLFQFQTFTTKQLEFLGEMVKDKNVVGLLRYGIAGYVFVNTVGKAMGMQEEELLPFYRFDTPPSLKLPVEVAKAAVDAPDRYGNDRDLATKASDIGKAAIGIIPGGMQIKKTIQGQEAVEQGGVFDKSGRMQFEQGDTPIAKLQTFLFGKYASPQAKEYFDKNKSTGKAALDAALEEESKLDAELNQRTTTLTNEIAKLPVEEGVARLKELAKTDQELAIKVRDRLRANKKKENWTAEDEGIAKLGVSNGARAKYIYERGLTMSPEDGTAYVKDLYSKGVISKDVVDQIKELQKSNKQPEKTTSTERNAIETVGAYATAFLVDPKNAAKALFTKEELGKVEGNLVELKRFYGNDFRAEDGSEAYIYAEIKKMNIPASERSNYNLEHIVPVSAGGDSSPSNLRIVTRELHNSYTPVDTALGKAVKDKTLTRKQAAKLATDFKNGVITKEDVYKAIE